MCQLSIIGFTEKERRSLCAIRPQGRLATDENRCVQHDMAVGEQFRLITNQITGIAPGFDLIDSEVQVAKVW